MILDMASGEIDFAADDFKVLLVTEEYRPSEAHAKRSDIGPQPSGQGYEPGGLPVEVSVDKIEGVVVINLGGAEWNPSTIRASGAVYYKSNGGAASKDQLVAHIPFDVPVVSNNGSFLLSQSMIELRRSGEVQL